jgi:hypothetical protein
MIEEFIAKLAEMSNKVLPSGSALATISAPTEPPAPGLLSIITDRFNLIESCCAIARPTMSLLPPGANGTISLIGLLS